MTTKEALDILIAYAPQFSYIVQEQSQFTGIEQGGKGIVRHGWEGSFHDGAGHCELFYSGSAVDLVEKMKSYVNQRRSIPSLQL